MRRLEQKIWMFCFKKSFSNIYRYYGNMQYSELNLMFCSSVRGRPLDEEKNIFLKPQAPLMQ